MALTHIVTTDAENRPWDARRVLRGMAAKLLYIA